MPSSRIPTPPRYSPSYTAESSARGTSNCRKKSLDAGRPGTKEDGPRGRGTAVHWLRAALYTPWYRVVKCAVGRFPALAPTALAGALLRRSARPSPARPKVFEPEASSPRPFYPHLPRQAAGYNFSAGGALTHLPPRPCAAAMQAMSTAAPAQGYAAAQDDPHS